MAPADADTRELGQALLDHVSATTSGAVVLAEPLAPVTGGFVNRIYFFSLAGAGCPPHLRGPLVLRLGGAWMPPDKLPREHAIQQRAFDLGFPTPEPLLLEPDPTVLGGPFQVMRRAPGAPLVEQVDRAPWTLPARLPAMADLLLRLHQLPTAGFDDTGPAVEDRILDALEDAGFTSPAVLGWLHDRRPPVDRLALCHLDFHPLNVLYEGKAPSALLDWENAGLGDPVHDLADASLVLTSAPAEVPGWLRPVESAARQMLSRRFRRRYRSRSPFDDERFRYYTALSATRRLTGAILDRPAEPGGDATGLSTPEYIAALAAVVEEVTGLAPGTG